jgi:hypothetical protein
VKKNPNVEYRNPKQARMNTEGKPPKHYDLEDRTFAFAKTARTFVKGLPKTIANIEDVKQCARASGSVGANYIEANEALGKKDFVMKIGFAGEKQKKAAIASV